MKYSMNVFVVILIVAGLFYAFPSLASSSDSADITLVAPEVAANKMPERYAPLHMEGRIGRSLSITMDLNFYWGQDSAERWESNVEGVYFYNKYRRDIHLSGTRIDEQIWLTEFDEQRAIKGQFVGSMVSNDCFKGTWKDLDGSQEFPFELQIGERKISKPKSSRGKKPKHATGFVDECHLVHCSEDVPSREGCEELKAIADCYCKPHENLPLYHLHLELNRSFQVRIVVSKGRQNEFVQSLFVPLFIGLPKEENFELLESLDMNFDGYKDIRLIWDYPPSGNFSCRVWLFDPANTRFVLNNPLSELTATRFDPETKTVNWHWRMGAGERVSGISRVDLDGKVTPINELHQRWSDDKKQILEIKKEFQNDKMTIVSVKPISES